MKMKLVMFSLGCSCADSAPHTRMPARTSYTHSPRPPSPTSCLWAAAESSPVLAFTPSQTVSQRAQLCERVCGRTGGQSGHRAQTLESASQLSGGRAKFSLEVQVLEGEVRLHDACGLDSGPQDVLLRGDVCGLGYPVQVVQVAGRKRRRRGEERRVRGEKKGRKSLGPNELKERSRQSARRNSSFQTITVSSDLERESRRRL